MSLIRPRIQTWDQPRQIVGGPQADGLLGAWPLAEGGGNTAIDLTGNANGTIIGAPASAPGNYGSALALNGSSQYITVPDNGPLRPTALTYAVWINTKSKAATGVGFKVTSGFSGWFLNINTRGGSTTTDGSIAWYNVNRTWLYADLGAGKVGDGQWHLITVTNDTASTTLYWDGLQVAKAFEAAPQPTGPLIIGSDPFHGWYFNGLISSPRMYKRGLAPSEIQSLYTDPLALVRPTLRRTWSIPSGPVRTRPRVMLIA